MPTRIDYAIEPFRTTSGGLTSDDLETCGATESRAGISITPWPTARTRTTSCLCSSAQRGLSESTRRAAGWVAGRGLGRLFK
jgi:hypothetical protein